MKRGHIRSFKKVTVFKFYEEINQVDLVDFEPEAIAAEVDVLAQVVGHQQQNLEVQVLL